MYKHSLRARLAKLLRLLETHSAKVAQRFQARRSWRLSALLIGSAVVSRSVRGAIPSGLMAALLWVGWAERSPGAEGSMGAVGWGQTFVNHQTLPRFDTPEVTHSGARLIATGCPGALVALTNGTVEFFITDPRILDVTGFGTEKLDGVAALAAASQRWEPAPFLPYVAALTTQGMVMNMEWVGLYSERLRTNVVAIAYQGNVLMAAMKDGTIEWPDRRPSGGPVRIEGGVQALAGGYEHGLALRRDGSIVAWGNNAMGQAQVPPDAKTGIVAIAAGGAHSLALRSDGRVVAFGSNDAGESSVPPAAREGVIEIAAGWNHSVALKADGTVICWGNDTFGQCSPPSWVQGLVRSISAGTRQTLALVATPPPAISVPPKDHTVPLGGSGPLTVTFTGAYPAFQWMRDGVPIDGATGASYSLRFAPPGSYSVSITNLWGSTTSSPPAIVKTLPVIPGTMVTWNDLSSDLVDPEERPLDVPTEVLGGVVAVAGGYDFSVALKENGSVVLWGGYEAKGLEVPEAAQRGVVGIAAGGANVFALKSDGRVVAWGNNFFGQTDVPVAALSGVRSLATGGAHCLAVKEDGSLVAWGRELAAVPDAARRGVLAVAAGSAHSLVLKSDGSVIAWGDNSSHQCDVPSTAVSGIVAIAAAGEFSIALTSEGGIVAWGNVWPPPVEAQSGVVAIAGDSDIISSALALKSDGSVIGWYWDPVQVPDVIQGKVMAIGGGGGRGLAILDSIRLRGTLSDGGLTLSWPNAQVGIRLESTSSPGLPNAWTEVSTPVRIFGAYASVTVPVSDAVRFFRLRR